MKAILLLSVCLSAPFALAAQANLSASPRFVENYGQLPLAFEANQGQSDLLVKFLSRGSGYSLFLTPDEAVLALRKGSWPRRTLRGAKGRTSLRRTSPETKSAVLRMKLLGARVNAEATGQDELIGKSNYFIGSDARKWHTDVPQFSKVRFTNVYPGIDLVYYGHQRELEYDFVLQPGTSTQTIRLGIAGAKRLRLQRGDLLLSTPAGNVCLRSPHLYQEIDGVRHKIRGRYVIKGNNEVGFEVATYDHRRELVIDPVVAYATLLGGSSDDQGNGIAVDAAGNAYVTGTTLSTDFPTKNALRKNHGVEEAFVTKINREGTGLIYSTYLGGNSADLGNGIAVDSAGNAYVTGYTDSTDFPMVHAIQPALAGAYDTFVTKINASGSALVYSTYLGGSWHDFPADIGVDSLGNAYVMGTTDSANFPIKNAIQPTYGGGDGDAFVTKINASGTAFVYSTYLGGSQREEGRDIAVDRNGRVYLTGSTQSTDFPIKNAFQTSNHGGISPDDVDVFVTKINASGSALVYSTYLGGNDLDVGLGIASDASGNSYVTGVTLSTDFPTVNPLQPTLPKNPHAFVTKIGATGGTPLYSTYLGGSGGETGWGIAVDASSNAYVIGDAGAGFPIVDPVQSSGASGFVSKINPTGTAFIYSTHLASFRRVVVDSAGSAYLVGLLTRNFPTTPLAFQLPKSGEESGTAVVGKLASASSVGLSVQKLTFAKQLVGTTSAPKNVKFTNQGSSSLPINKIFIGGLNGPDFAETNNCGATLAQGASCTAHITFTPSVKNTRAAGLGFSTPDPASPDAVGLSGTGTVVSLSTSKLLFGDQAVGTVSSPQVVTLTNTGTTDLRFSGIVVTGTNRSEFSQTNTCGSSIASKATCTIKVTFAAGATGIRKASLYINDDGGASPQPVTLTGTGK